MPVSLWTGPPRSGKTYDVVQGVMVPAFRSGRDIVTNIRGIDPDKWAAGLSPFAGKRLGSIVVVDDEFLADEDSYPSYDAKAGVQSGAIADGSLVVIDEAYTVFGAERGMVTRRMLKWVMTHGQFTGPTGVCSDVVMIAQDLSLLAPKVRNVAENVFAVRNLRFIHPKLGRRYRVFNYSSWRCTLTQLVGRSVRVYKDEVFALYKSTNFDGVPTVEQTKRGSGAVSPFFLVLAALSLIGAIGGAWVSYRNFIGRHKSEAASLLGMKPDCSRSGVLFDVTQRRAFVNGEWKDAKRAPAAADGRVGYDVGPCVFRFGGGVHS